MNRRAFIGGALAIMVAQRFAITLTEASMAITGQFFLRDYSVDASGAFILHFENPSPGPGNPTDYYLGIPQTELPTNISQPQLAAALKTQLGLKLNQTHAPLNTFIGNGTAVTLP